MYKAERDQRLEEQGMNSNEGRDEDVETDENVLTKNSNGLMNEFKFRVN